jgi:hypothetical protein
MALVRCTDPEAVALMAEIAERSDVIVDDIPFGNFILELWEEDAKTFSPRAVCSQPKDRIQEVFQAFGRQHLRACGLGWARPLDAVAAREKMLELLVHGLWYFSAYEDVTAAQAFLDRLFAWLGPGAVYLMSLGAIQVPHWVDEGVAFATPARVGFLWCLGTD